MSETVLIAAVVIGLGTAARGQELATFLDAADRTSPELREAGAVVAARNAERGVAAGGLYPRLDVQGRYLRNQYAAETFAPIGPGGQPRLVTLVPADQLDLTVNLSWPLIDGARRGELGALAYAREAARADRDRRRLDLHRAIVAAFFDHAGAVETLSAARRAVESAVEFARLARMKLEAGVAAPLDVARALADEADRRQSLADAQRSAGVAAARLESASGMPVDRAPAMPVSLLRAPGPLPADVVERHSELAAARFAALAAAARVDASRAAWLPTLSATASELVTNSSGFTGKSATFTAGVVAAVPLDVARWRTTALYGAEAASAEERVALSRRRVRQRLAEDAASATAAVASLEAARARADAAVLTARLVLERFDAGAAASFEVVSARRDAFLAEAAVASARAALGAAHASLRLSAGLDALPGDEP